MNKAISDIRNDNMTTTFFAEKHLLSESMTAIKNTDLAAMRKLVACKIMIFEHYLTDCCPKCGFPLADDDKMQCQQCYRWYHFKPYCLADDVTEMKDEEEFVCRLCRVNFWPNNHLSLPATNSKEQNSIKWTSKHEILKKLQKSTELDHEVICLDAQTSKVDTSAVVKAVLKRKRGLRQTQFMNRPRSSFVYFPLKKQKKTFCVCQKENDGGLYWFCITCEDWFHPTCIGMSPANEPPDFICPSCTTKSISDDSGDKSSLLEFNVPDFVHECDSDDDVSLEDDFFITSQIACQHMKFAVSRLQSIVAVTGKQREQPWLTSHYKFLKGHQVVASGYGFAVFSVPAVETVRYHVKNVFYQNAPGHIYTTAGQVKGMKDAVAKGLFEKDVFLAMVYIEEVLVKEAITAIFQSYTGCQYHEADSECMLVVNKSKNKATADGIKICGERKKVLEKRFFGPT